MGFCVNWTTRTAVGEARLRISLPACAGFRTAPQQRNALPSLPAAPLSRRRRALHRRRYTVQVTARNIILFSRREAARSGIQLPMTDSRARHVAEHLQLLEGDTVRVGVVNGLKGTALVKDVTEEAVHLLWNTWQDPSPPPPVTLVLVLPRPKVLRRLWKQIAEMGVQQVVITKTNRVPSGYDNCEALRPHVMLREILQGLEQAGDTLIPKVVYAPVLATAIDYAQKEWPLSNASYKKSEGRDWDIVRTILDGPNVTQKKGAVENGDAAASATSPSASPAAGAVSALDGDSEEGSERLAFITQCLQVRRRLEDAKFEGRPVAVVSTPNAKASVEQAVNPRLPLRIVCHPGASSLLSDAVVRYKAGMNRSGYHVWNWAEVNDEHAQCSKAHVGAAGDHYYGSSAGGKGGSDQDALAGILAEVYNTGRHGFASPDSGPNLIGEDQGTSPIDASRWGVGKVVVAIGPERGWTDAELDELQAQGFEQVGMGGRTMSSPVAVLSVLAIVQEALR